MSNAQTGSQPRIALSKSAIKKLMNDLTQGEKRAGNKLPILVYFRRAYSTSHDGTITENGDGFSLTSTDPDDEKKGGPSA